MARPQVKKATSTANYAIPNTHTPQSLRIMTYNCLGLKYISQHRRARLAEIGHAIALHSPPPQIVALQECWTQEDYASIRSSTTSILPYGKFYYSGIFGGGLAILSAFPIEDSSMYRYPLNGRPTAFFRGDWYVGKGVACATIRLPPRDVPSHGEKTTTDKGDTVEVFCTHLHAPYETEPGDSYLCHRTAQAWEIAKLMRGAAERGHLVVGLGDFNMLPLSLAHRVITARGGVVDAWRVLHPNSSLGPATVSAEKDRKVAIPNAKFNLEVNGAASDNVLNTWRWTKSLQKAQYGKGDKKGPPIVVPMDTPDPHAKRLDYIFVGNGRHAAAASSPASESEWEVTDMHVGMTQLHPTIHCSLSDHFSINATLTRAPATIGTTSTASQPPSPDRQTQSEIVQTYKQILTLIQTYTTREVFQRKARLAHFIFWLILALGCFVSVWFSPRPFVSFIIILLSTLGFAMGVIDGLIGGLFMSSELRALKEFEWEVSNAIAVSVAGNELGKREVQEKG